MAGSILRERIVIGIGALVGKEGVIDIEEIGVGAQFVSPVVVVVIRQLVGELR